MGIRGLTDFIKEAVCAPYQSYTHVYIEINAILHASYWILELRARIAHTVPSVAVIAPILLQVLDYIVQQLPPTETLFLACDGPSTAKLPEQQIRRAACNHEPDIALWKLAVTPYTAFMQNINAHLWHWAQAYVQRKPSVQVVVADSQVCLQLRTISCFVAPPLA